MRNIIGSKEPLSFEIKEIIDSGPALTKLKIRLLVVENETKISKTVDFILLNEDENGSPIPRGLGKGKWFLNSNLSGLEYFDI